MLRKLLYNYTDRYLARWVVFIFDLLVVVVSYALAVLMRFNFELEASQSAAALQKVGLVTFIYAAGFMATRSYAGIIRHTSIRDAVNVFKGSILALGLLVSISLTYDWFSPESAPEFFVARSILLIHFFCTLFFLISSRLMVKAVFDLVKSQKHKKQTRVLIFGAGSSGLATMNALQKDTNQDFEIVGFVDDNPYKLGKAIEGALVYSPERAFSENFLRRNRPDHLIISVQKDLSPTRKKEIVEKGLENGLQVKVVPPLETWIHGELSSKQIKPVKIEELLERDPIVLDNVNVSREVKDRTVLVTGAAGSIGSEIARQLIHYSPKQVILLDQAESALHDLHLDLKEQHPHLVHLCDVVIADVTSELRMKQVFTHFDIDVVYHAAAYKHVPLMEDNPSEALAVNVFGSRMVADLAVRHKVSKFVMVSTDKAVNPTNVMGASKRTAEIYTQALGMRGNHSTQFIITRFGNVLGSNGSVIPLFKKQIERGGPITLTDKRITRYFMTIPEACNLVLEAGAMGKGGEIFVFDMGESVKIYDLAKKMIKLSGLRLNRDIEIKEVGLRPGEKLFEELLAVKENTKKTYHPKIMIAETAYQEYKDVRKSFDDLKECLESSDNLKMVACLKGIVPEFISNNSIYASLDMKKIVND